MARNQKLELQWIGKDQRPRLEPRILLQDLDLSYHASERFSANDLFDNRLIFGDNLLALKALEQEFTGKIKCIFIDPPYNTGSAFEHYDDGIEHSVWLSLMSERLALLWRLLGTGGSIWITIDDNEAHYLKVLCDEVFGRASFVANIVWQKRTSRENRAAIGSAHDHILLYAKGGPVAWKAHRNPLPSSDAGFSNPDGDKRGPWRSIPFTAQGFRANQMYKITTDAGNVVEPPRGRCWGATEPVFEQLRSEGRIYFPKNGTGRPRVKQFAGEEKGLVPMTWWDASMAGDNEAAKKEMLELFPTEELFSTPKPELLLRRIIEIASNPGEWVLDSFAGSGTTGAVAHKMGRRWIMVELGVHARTHIVPRLRKVIDGTDLGGITEAFDWQGGGGFRYYNLAPSLIRNDKWGNPVISETFKQPELLAEAVCKLEGFTYAPTDIYWQQGYSTERDFIYVTTQKLTRDQLQSLSDEVGDDRTLLVCCAAFRSKPDAFANLTIKKIPHAVLSRCEWGRDDYSLQIKNLPAAPDLGVADDEPPAKSAKGKAKKSASDDSLSLFDTAPTK
jgi:adenine-specific DNA-methyltransferase